MVSAQTSEAEVDFLLIGPTTSSSPGPGDPGLVVVALDLIGHDAGAYTLAPQVRAPEGLQVELFPPEVKVTLVEK